MSLKLIGYSDPPNINLALVFGQIFGKIFGQILPFVCLIFGRCQNIFALAEYQKKQYSMEH